MSKIIDINDYFSINLLKGKSGKVSSDQSRIYFDDLVLNIEHDNNALFIERFAPSSVVHPVIMVEGSDSEIYWMFSIVTPIPKSKKTAKIRDDNYVTVISTGKF